MKHTPPPGQASHALAPRPPLAVVPKGKGHSVRIESTVAAGAGDRVQRIRQRAYARYEARGCAEGHALDDWLLAEEEVAKAEAATPGPLHAG